MTDSKSSYRNRVLGGCEM